MGTPTLRELFLKYLTQDNVTQDRRRKEYNRAIFDAEEGWAVYCNTSLDMVLDKFDKANREYSLVSHNVNKEAQDGN